MSVDGGSRESFARRRKPALALAALALVALGVAAGSWWESRQDSGAKTAVETDRRLAAAGIGKTERAAIEALVRDYILAHPEILPEAMERLQAQGAVAQIAAERADLEKPFDGAVLGNPRGTVTLVEFSDYGCGYCRQSAAEVRELADAHPDLRIVVRELPILSPASEQAARMGLAAARQGRYAAFHHAMFAGARPDPTSVGAAAHAAGVDPVAAKAFANSAEAQAELSRNHALASRLGINGTPAWIVGDRLLIGAVGREKLEEAIAEARHAG